MKKKTSFISFLTLIILTLTLIFAIFIQSCRSERSVFSSKISFIPYLEYRELAKNEKYSSYIEKTTPGMSSLLTHTLDERTYIEVIVLELANDLPASDVKITLFEYMHKEYNVDYAYSSEALNSLIIADKENCKRNAYTIDLKTFSNSNKVIIPIAVTIPIDDDSLLYSYSPEDFNSIPHLAVSCYIKSKKGIIGTISFTYNGKNYKENIYEMRSVSHS